MRTNILSKFFIIWSLLTGFTGVFGVSSAWADINNSTIPIHDKEGVVPVYSTQYGNHPGGLDYPNWDEGQTQVSKETINGKEVLKFSNLYLQPIQISGGLNISSTNFLNIDVYLDKDVSSFTVRIGDGAEYQVEKGPLTKNEWHTLTIPLSDFAANNISPTPFVQVGLGNTQDIKNNVTAYLDNIFFYSEFTNQNGFEPAPTHDFDITDNRLIPIYSTQYNKIGITSFQNWGQDTEPGFVLDKNNKNIFQFSNFDYQPISFYDNDVVSSSVTHVNVDIYFEETVNKLEIQIFNDKNTSITYKTNSLAAGKWHTLYIPLKSFTWPEGVNDPMNINSIRFASETTGKTAYLDNIFFYNEIKIPAANVPKHTNITNFYSTKYGTSTKLAFNQWGSNTTNTTKKDENDNPLLKFSDFGRLAMVYEDNNLTLPIPRKDRLNLAVYPEANIASFNVKLMLFADRIPEITEIVEKTYSIGSLTANQWNYITIDLKEYYTATKDNQYITGIEPSSGSTSTNIYLDHIYFYNSEEKEIDGAPKFSAYLPPVRDKGDVISLLGDSYTDSNIQGNITFSDKGTNGQTTEAQTTLIMNREVEALINMNHISIAVPNVNVGSMGFFHLDIYSPVETNLTIKLNGNEQTPVPLSAGFWTRIDLQNPVTGNLNTIDLSVAYSGKDKPFFIDNIYFYKKGKVSSTPITDIAKFNTDLGSGTNMGGLFEMESTYSWDKSIAQAVKANGLKHIRLPIRWDDFPSVNNPRSLQEAPYNIDADFLVTIQEAIDDILESDLKVILNIHHFNALMGDNGDAETDRFLALWEQLTDYFQNYDERLVFEILNEPSDKMDAKWNIFFPDAINVIRKESSFRNDNNKNRAIMVGTTDFGTINGLQGTNALNIQQVNDNRLIVTIHYYNPMEFTHQGADWVVDDNGNPLYPLGTRWYDTQDERAAVKADFDLIKAYQQTNTVPIHIGEFGVFNIVNIDSRALWTNYIASTIKEYGFSSAYWTFDDIYDMSTKQNKPYMADALLKYSRPDAAVRGTIEKEAIYDSTGKNGAGWNLYVRNDEDDKANATQSTQTNGFTVHITNGGDTDYSVQSSLSGLSLEKGKSYEVSFTAKGSVGGNKYIAYLGRNDLNGSYAEYGKRKNFTPTTTAQQFKFTLEMLDDTDNAARIAFDMGKGNAEEVTITDITLKEVILAIPSAPTPSNSEVISIFSSFYTGSLYTPAESDLTTDMNKNDIILLSDFASKMISLGSQSLGEKKMLHLEIYPESWFDITIQAGNVSKVYTLNPHTWNSINIDLTEASGTINSITLSGGTTGQNRRIYLDHIYFYQKSSTPGPGPGKEPTPSQPAPTPSLPQGDVISIFSNPYVNISSVFETKPGQKTVVDTVTISSNPVWRLTHTDTLTVNVGPLDVSTMNYLYLDVWSPYTGTLKVYLSDGTNETSAITLSVVKEKWQTYRISLSDLSVASIQKLKATGNLGNVDLTNIKYIRFENNANGTFYLDNFYFSKTVPSGNATIDDNTIDCRVVGDYLYVDTQTSIRSIDIIDLSGRLVIKKNPDTNTAVINITTLNKGVYILQVVTINGEYKSIKFIKK